jgi:hypothetical protein
MKASMNSCRPRLFLSNPSRLLSSASLNAAVMKMPSMSFSLQYLLVLSGMSIPG